MSCYFIRSNCFGFDYSGFLDAGLYYVSGRNILKYNSKLSGNILKVHKMSNPLHKADSQYFEVGSHFSLETNGLLPGSFVVVLEIELNLIPDLCFCAVVLKRLFKNTWRFLNFKNILLYCIHDPLHSNLESAGRGVRP